MNGVFTQSNVVKDLYPKLHSYPNSSRLGISRLDPLIQRLQHSCIDRRDHIHRRIQFFFGHSRFPRVRKATIDSRIAEPHHRNGEADQHLFALAEALDGMRVAVESSKVGFLQGDCSSSFGSHLASGVLCLAFVDRDPTTLDPRP